MMERLAPSSKLPLTLPFTDSVKGTVGIVTYGKGGWWHIWRPLHNRRDGRGAILAELCEESR